MLQKEVYIHRCSKNELGYRKGEAKKAGRFIFISSKYFSFFPHLSKQELNDNILINIIDNKDSIYLCNYIYHNSKYATKDTKKTRNECRIYFNNEIDKKGELFKPNDILIFTKYKIEGEYYYKLYYLPKAKNTKDYNFFKKVLNSFQTSQSELNHLTVCSDVLPSKYKKNILFNINEKIISKDIIGKSLEHQSKLFEDLEKLAKEGNYVPNDETGLIKSNNFRDMVLFAYNNKCAITQESILYKGLSNLEAAHIMPQAHNGPDSLGNGLALCRDLHWAFDKGLFTIILDDGMYKVKIHDKAINDNKILKSIDGKEIFVPEDSRFRINRNALEYHKAHLYGSFKQIRSK